MSLENPLIIYPPDKLDPRYAVVFYDDFIGAAYDDQIWAVIGSSGSITSLDENGGRVRVRADRKTNSWDFYMNDKNAYSVAKVIDLEWRASFGAYGAEACGMEDTAIAGDHDANKFRWWRSDGIANFQIRSTSGGTTTSIDSGIPVDTGTHLFRIVASPGFLQFFLDGQIKGVITTNITGLSLQPYISCSSLDNQHDADVTADYVLVAGDA